MRTRAPMPPWPWTRWATDPALVVNDPVVAVRVSWPLFPLLARTVYEDTVPDAAGVFIRWKDRHTLLVMRWRQDGSGRYATMTTLRVE